MLFLSGFLSYFLARFFGALYDNVFNSYGFFGWGGESLQFIIGFPIAYLFFLSLLFTALGDQHKKYWIGIASIPALAFLLYFDFSHIYFHILFPLVGWLIGWGILKLKPKSLA